MPRWGVWVDGCFYYDGAPTTRHVRNVEGNPACTLHLENGAEAVIVEGNSPIRHQHDPDDLGARLSTAFEKYHPAYSPGPDSWAGEQAACGSWRPKRALAWFSFPQDCTKFTFAD